METVRRNLEIIDLTPEVALRGLRLFRKLTQVCKRPNLTSVDLLVELPVYVITNVLSFFNHL